MSDFYGKAHSIAATPPLSKVLNAKTWTSTLQYNEFIFEAHAFYFAHKEEKKKLEETATGIGPALAYLRKAGDHVNAIKKFEQNLTPGIVSQFKSAMAQYNNELTELENDNKKIYFEPVPELKNLPLVEKQSFVKSLSMEEELKVEVENGNAFDQIIPMEVRQMQDEYKMEINNYLNKFMGESQALDKEEQDYLRRYNLPECVHAISSEEGLPNEVWNKIEKANEKGGVGGVENMAEGVKALSHNNIQIIEGIEKQLIDEETDDTTFRNKYGPAWNRMPSNSLNENLKKQVEYYKNKFQQAAAADTKIFQKLEINKPELMM